MKNACIVMLFTCALLACDYSVAQPTVEASPPDSLSSDKLPETWSLQDASGQPPSRYKVAQHTTQPKPLLTPLEAKILEVAKTCKRAKKKYIDEALLTDLILMERAFGVPKDMRGMLLASACTESGYNPNAEGDHKFSKRGKPKAIGLLQLWKWWEKPVSKGGYAVNRRDPLANAHAWMSHIKKQYPKVRKKCKISRKHVSRIWRVAWVTAIRAPKPEGRCNEFPNHYRRLKKWKKQWRKLL
jgi:hypothetical protein